MGADTINPGVLAAQYAVRGELPTRAAALQRVLDAGGAAAAALPFREIVYCNVGNPLAVGNRPYTYNRQVLALCDCPDLLQDLDAATAEKLFPADVQAAARRLLQATGIGGTGAYSESAGVALIRQDVAEYMNARDGLASEHPLAATAADVFLSNGSSGAILMLLSLLADTGSREARVAAASRTVTHSDAPAGVLIPVPQYPIYSALLTVLGMHQLQYHLQEHQQWALDVTELERLVQDARQRGIDPRALVVISPGNPTGQLLEAANVQEILAFAHRERLLLLADEVYADNVYVNDRRFESFRRVLHRDMPPEVQRELELVSLYSASKGLVSECGRRGGYMLLSPAITSAAREQLTKIASIMLCPNLGGQVMVDCVVRPPQPGQPSYPLYARERAERFASLQRRAQLVVQAFRSMTAVECNPSQGAMYAFPRVRVSARAAQAARDAGMPLDTFYCVSLLERTGICVVPGAGFGMRSATEDNGDGSVSFYLRTTILPPEDKMHDVMDAIKKHHQEFLRKYGSVSKM